MADAGGPPAAWTDADIEHKRRARFPVFVVGLSMVGFITIKTARDALFFRDAGLAALPAAYVWIAAASLPAAMLHLAAMDRWGARRVRTGIFAVTGIGLLGFVPSLGEPGNGEVAALLFIMVPTLFAALFAGAWLLAGDLLDGSSTRLKRWAYTRIGAASMVGGIGGGLLARGLSRTTPPAILLVAGCGLVLAVGFVVAYAHRRYPSPESAARPRPPSATARLRQHAGLLGRPYVATLMGISGLAAVAALFIDFQFYAGATLTGRDNTAFFAEFYIYLNAVSLVLQLLAAPRLQARFGVAGALLTLPAALLGAGGVLSLGITVHARAVLRVAEGGLKASVYRSIWEQAFLPLARDERAVAKVFVDGIAARLGEGVGAAALFAWLQVRDAVSLDELTWIWWVIAAVLGIWLALTRRLRHLEFGGGHAEDAVVRLLEGCPCASALGAEAAR